MAKHVYRVVATVETFVYMDEADAADHYKSRRKCQDALQREVADNGIPSPCKPRIVERLDEIPDAWHDCLPYGETQDQRDMRAFFDEAHGGTKPC